jgi:hypothetical protein
MYMVIGKCYICLIGKQKSATDPRRRGPDWYESFEMDPIPGPGWYVQKVVPDIDFDTCEKKG